MIVGMDLEMAEGGLEAFHQVYNLHMDSGEASGHLAWGESWRVEEGDDEASAEEVEVEVVEEVEDLQDCLMRVIYACEYFE